jgi:hypothetical protein
MSLLNCQMTRDCREPVNYIDNKGFVYCNKHGLQRKASGIPCRRLGPPESKKLERGVPISYQRKTVPKHDSEILEGIPRGVWADFWAQEQEEKGRSFSGQEITSLAPKTPAWAKQWAREVADEIVKLNGKSLQDLYAMVANRELTKPFPYARDQFGLLLGMETVGHGISWLDDTRGLPEDAIKLPSRQFYR